MSKRFDIVVFTHQRILSFYSHFHRIRNFDPGKDRITVVSCSPSNDERSLNETFTKETGFPVRYLVRENRGIDQLARAQYFGGTVGSLSENTSYTFIFQMQDHYLDAETPSSRYGAEGNHALKGDVAPDSAVFDLDGIESIANEQSIALLFSDRMNPCWFRLYGNTFIAPSGGNFIVRSAEVLNVTAQAMIRRLMESCDDTYDWAVFAEFMWGYIFFKEGRIVYDLKRLRPFTSFERKDFYLHGGRSNPRFREVFCKYHASLGLPRPLFVSDTLREVAGRILHRVRRLLTRPAVSDPSLRH